MRPVRIQDIEICETYTASIPQRLPAAMRSQALTIPAAWQAQQQLYLLRGKRVQVTVTGYGDEPGTVVVTQQVPANHAVLRLTAEQTAGLGLAEGQEYDISGLVTDQDGRIVTFPASVVHTIPARWLRPRDEHLILHPDSEALRRAKICWDADGKTPAEVHAACDRALEKLRQLQGIALEGPDADWPVLTAEADHHEWLRIAAYLQHTGLETYDPRSDPEAVRPDGQLAERNAGVVHGGRSA